VKQTISDSLTILRFTQDEFQEDRPAGKHLAIRVQQTTTDRDEDVPFIIMKVNN